MNTIIVEDDEFDEAMAEAIAKGWFIKVATGIDKEHTRYELTELGRQHCRTDGFEMTSPITEILQAIKERESRAMQGR